LAVNRETLEAVAVKIVDLSRHPSVEKNIRKEVSHYLSVVRRWTTDISWCL